MKGALYDLTLPESARTTAGFSLAAIGTEHPELRDDIVALLAEFLDRPTADASAAEEDVTTWVIYALSEMGAASAYPAIKRAFDEDRVNLTILGLDDVEVDFGMRPPPDFSELPKPRSEPGVALALRCKRCGRERHYRFERVYFDAGTVQAGKEDRYDPVIIPERVTCTKCGAVDEYELGTIGQYAIMGDLMVAMGEDLPFSKREDQRVQIIQFAALGRRMHPQEALAEYRKRLKKTPRDPDLHLGYANVLRFLSYRDEARAEYHRSLELESFNPEPHVALAELAWEAGDLEEARKQWSTALEIVLEADLDDELRADWIADGREALAAIAAGEPPPSAHPVIVKDDDSREAGRSRGRQGRTVPKSEDVEAYRAAPRPAHAAPKVGRNDPCPCGSGRKYKHCHGKK